MFSATNAFEKNLKTRKRRTRRLNISPLRIAIIDLGTNSVRCDIYRINGKRIERLHRGKRMIRLGDGVFQSGELTQEAMNRALHAFYAIRRQLAESRVDHVIAFGTSALRSAKNSREFLDEIRKRTHISIQIISGQEEGRLIACGIMSSLPTPKGVFAMVDIGGGSTEISLANGKRLLSCQSYQLGANRLWQMYLKTVPPIHKRGQLNPVLALRQHLKDSLHSLTVLREKYAVKTLIGSSGTIRTIGKILKKLGRSSRTIHRSDLSALISEMQTMTRSQLLKLPGLEPRRLDLILPGAILLEEVMLALNMRSVLVTDIALRDGILQRELNNLYDGETGARRAAR